MKFINISNWIIRLFITKCLKNFKCYGFVTFASPSFNYLTEYSLTLACSWPFPCFYNLIKTNAYLWNWIPNHRGRIPMRRFLNLLKLRARNGKKVQRIICLAKSISANWVKKELRREFSSLPIFFKLFVLGNELCNNWLIS